MAVSSNDPVRKYEERKRREQDELEEVKAEKVAHTAYDLQRIKLERLIKNIDKPAPIPAARKAWTPYKPPEFVRNIVGSSAGAGSGEYHIFRNSRRRETARLQHMDHEAKEDEKDKQFQEQRQKNMEENEARAAKKRAKRLKKKKNRGKKKQKLEKKEESCSEEDSDDNSDEEREGGEGEEKREETKE